MPANSWFRALLIQALLINRSPLLDDLTTDAVEQLRLHPSFAGKPLSALFGLQRALAALGITEPPKRRGVQTCAEIADAPQVWTAAVEKWFATSTLSRNVRRGYRTILARAGRWLAVNHPEVTEPGQWTRQTCAAWVAAVDRLNRGDYVQDPTKVGSDSERPLSPSTKIAYLRPLRVFFNDLQEWEWIHRRFDPRRAFETPRTLRAIVGPDPRVIADDVWAKLLWAGINLHLPRGAPGHPSFQQILAVFATAEHRLRPRTSAALWAWTPPPATLRACAPGSSAWSPAACSPRINLACSRSHPAPAGRR